MSSIIDYRFHDAFSRPLLDSVPSELMKYTVATDSFGDFQRGGYEVYTMMNAAAVKHNNAPLHAHQNLLDFGCGAGRILQFLPTGGQLAGCDVNGHLVRFTENSFPEAGIYQNNMTPPLKWASASFDLVYSFSVFSHLTLENERAWLREFHRVGRPGCLYLITVHGDWFIEATLPPVEQELIRETGFLFRDVHQRTGSEMDFPNGYEASYHTSNFIRDDWGKEFEVLEVYKGNDALHFLHDSMTAEEIDVLGRLRPMGQDLVVMRKRAS